MSEKSVTITKCSAHKTKFQFNLSQSIKIKLNNRKTHLVSKNKLLRLNENKSVSK